MTDTPTLPDLTGLRSLLTAHLGRTAYIIPMTDRRDVPIGNNGDHLMLMVFDQILKDFGIATTGDPARAELAIVPPNGAILEAYAFPDILAERLSRLQHLPLVLFPSSAYFPKRDPSFIFRGRRAETLWILREKFSFDHLHTHWLAPLQANGVRLALDHDVVASGHAFVPAIIGAPLARRHTLVAARIDREATSLDAPGPSGAAAGARLVDLGKRLIEALPHARTRTALTRAIRRDKLRGAGSRLLAAVPASFASADPALPMRFVDSSAVRFATFDEYREAIRGADLIVTDRLHVGLPGTILGKRVVLVEAGYHKLGGVYRQSLSRCPNVTFVRK